MTRARRSASIASIPRDELRAADFADIATGQRLAPVHPGEVLREEFIKPLGITRYRAAKALGIQQRRLDEICSGARAVTADTALRLERAFGMSAEFWMRLQAGYDLEVARRVLSSRINAEAKPLAA
jgi:addiction module HigA family antidote